MHDPSDGRGTRFVLVLVALLMFASLLMNMAFERYVYAGASAVVCAYAVTLFLEAATPRRRG